MWAVNVRAVIQLTRDAMRVMSGGGRIVNVVSTAGLAGQAGEAAYCATKFAVRGFTEAAAEEGRLTGVRVTGVYPAGVETGFWDDAVGDRSGFTGDKAWLTPGQVASQIVAVLRTPVDIDVPTLVIRHPGDVDLAGMAAKLERIRRA
jgi:short-subunit dehydrogenase